MQRTEDKIIVPPKPKGNKHIRVIAPARSLNIIIENIRNAAIDRLQKAGFKISFGQNVMEQDDFFSSSIESRLEDLHDAFRDRDVNIVLTAIGGYNSNQLLRYIDYDLIASNPKILCGFSDITVLSNAILAKSGMITYCGPHFSSWGMKYGFEYSSKYFLKNILSATTFMISPSDQWSDDPWYMNQEKRNFINNEDYWILNDGNATGRIVGGHARGLSALQGTEYWPGFNNSILILEEDEETNPFEFDRLLQSFIHQPDFTNIKGILIGRFQKKTNMSKRLLKKIVSSKTELNNMPVIANVDVGHTTPIATFPIGGTIKITTLKDKVKLHIIRH